MVGIHVPKWLSILLLVAFVVGGSVPAAAQAIAYPNAPRDPTVENFHGTPVADPYRWLEQPSDPRTARWLASERRLTRSYLAHLPGRDEIRRRVVALVEARRWGTGKSP